MQKYLKLSNIIPEAVALLIVLTTAQRELSDIYLSLIIYSLLLRFIWQSAIIVHGLGHTVAIAISDHQLSFFNLTNILEHQTIATILKSLLPCHQIFIPILSPSASPASPVSLEPYLNTGNPEGMRLKAIGGIIFNLLITITFAGYSNNFFVQAVIVANLLIAFASLSDLEAMITGVADCFYCGNFGLIARRKPEDGKGLLPSRMVEIAQQMGRETEVRGEQAGGGLVIAKQNNYPVFVGKKIVNQKRSNLTQSLEAKFASVRNKAIASGIKPLESSITGVWHYRYATSGTAPSELETHWHEWMGERKQEVYRFTDKEWICETKNVHHRITHNGDFNSWQIFNRDINNRTLGWWLERVLHTPNATKGDSPKIAGMMDLLVTQGMWYASVRLAYQLAIATTVKDAFGGGEPTADAPNTAPSKLDLDTWAKIFEGIFTNVS